MSIALDAKRLTEDGKSLREVRDYIDRAYSGVGPSTNTPYPPQGA